jgi:uncharacterized protein (DUF427 family)
MSLAGTKDHPITIEPIAGRVRVIWRGRTIGETTQALELKEAGYKPVLYIPREDFDMRLLERTDRVTHCPYKGDANYYTIKSDDARDDNAVWTYERPKEDVADIAGRLAFYPAHVEVVREGP